MVERTYEILSSVGLTPNKLRRIEMNYKIVIIVCTSQKNETAAKRCIHSLDWIAGLEHWTGIFFGFNTF